MTVDYMELCRITSPIMMTAAFGLPLTMVGIIPASATRKPEIP
jgi:hypothetical protein